MSDFADKLQSIVSLHLTEARRGDPAATADMIERLCNSLGLVIAVASKGIPENAQELLTGVESYVYEAVAQHSPLAKMLARS